MARAFLVDKRLKKMKEEFIEFIELDLAASLEALHHKVSLKMISPTTVLFSVLKTPTTEKIVETFRNGTLLVNPTAFLNRKLPLYQAIQRMKEEQHG